MNYKFVKKYTGVNIFILLILFLLGFAALYFLYFRVRSQENIYVTITLSREPQWVPYWIGQSIKIGDKETSPLGELNTEVIDKESYEAHEFGELIYLLLKVKAIKDRSGIYLFKNKPLAVGSVIDLKLSNTEIKALVIDISKELPYYEYKKITVTVQGKELWPYTVDAITVGSKIIDSKGREIAKIVDKKVSPAEIRVDTASGFSIISYDRRKRDVILTLEILVKKINDTYYFRETDKVKVAENLFLPFSEESINLPISSVAEIEE